jgi:CRP-like cAMP-binding protein
MDQVLLSQQLLGTKSKRNLALSSTQLEILPKLEGSSIHDIIHSYMRNRLLISFQALYELIQFMVSEKLILNPALQVYFSQYPKEEPGLFEELISKVVGPDTSGIHLKTELQKIAFFRSLEAPLLETFIDHAKMIETPADILVCQTGQKQRSLFVMLRGEASVYKSGEASVYKRGEASVYKRDSKNQRRKVATLKEGSVFGEVGFLLGEPRTADVITDQKSVIARIKYVPEIFDSLIQKEKARHLQKRFWVIHALLKSEIFRELPSDCFDSLLFAGTLRSFSSDSLLCREGDSGTSCYVVVQGNLVVSKGGKSIRVLQQGDCFGEIALLLSQGKRTASVLSQTEVLVLEIPADKFYQLMADNLLLACEFERIAKSRIERDQDRG